MDPSGTWRRSTASSWRRTSSSRSFERDDLQVRSRSRRTWRSESVIRRTVTGPVLLPVDWCVGPNQAADRDVAPFRQICGKSPGASAGDKLIATVKHVLLHDHLDGGLRPTTLVELADRIGIALPSDVSDAGDLESWFRVVPGMDLGEAFSRFDLPCAVMQDAASLHRVAYEAAIDLAADSVDYAEVRFAPFLHTERGLSADAVVDAVVGGLRDGPIPIGLILCAIRTANATEALVDLAIAWRDRGVVGVDLAGLEIGYPIDPHAPAFRRASSHGLGVTIHAGEMDRFENVAAALHLASADRIGHGWQLIDDCRVVGGEIVEMGKVAEEVHARQIPLEMCISSNACLGVPPQLHPLPMMLRAGFNISLNTDNRTITASPLSQEFAVVQRIGCSAADVEKLRSNATRAAFT